MRLVQVEAHFGVDRLQAVFGRLQLGPAYIVGAMHHLTLQVTKVNHVEIDEAEATHAGGGEVQAQWRAEAARADEQDRRRLEAFLAVHADFGHDEVAAVAGDFLRREGDVRRAGGKGVEGGWHGVISRNCRLRRSARFAASGNV